MKDSENMLREAVNRAWRTAADGDHVSFADTWRAAEQRHAAARRRYRRFATVATLVAIVVIRRQAMYCFPTGNLTYIRICRCFSSQRSRR